MNFDKAVASLEMHALTILGQAGSNVRLLAVGSKDRLPLSDASDFCVTAYVPEKLTEAQLRKHKIAPFHESFALAARTLVAEEEPRHRPAAPRAKRGGI